MKQLPIVVLKGCPYVGVPLCKVCVPSAFGGRAGFDMDASHLFPQGVLAAITLLGGGGKRGKRRIILVSELSTWKVGAAIS